MLGTEFRYHGIARDGLYILWDCTGRHAENDFTRYLYGYAASSVSYDTIALFSTVLYANVTACHGMDDLYPFIEWGAEKINVHAYNVLLHLASSHLRSAALTTGRDWKISNFTGLHGTGHGFHGISLGGNGITKIPRDHGIVPYPVGSREIFSTGKIPGKALVVSNGAPSKMKIRFPG